MPKFNVSKTVLINAPLDKVRATVRDFQQWIKWSPWLIAEPECEVKYAEDGRSYSWDGKIVGSGEMAITNDEAVGEIHYALTFLKPWKSVSIVMIKFVERDGGVEATWTMDGSLPFFMFWMKPMMTAFVGMDFQRGLNMLKDYVETGTVPSVLEFTGKESFSGIRYFGVNRQCSIDEIGPIMTEDFQKLRTAFDENQLQPAGMPVVIYHKWNMTKGIVEYTVGLPVGPESSNAPAGLVSGEIPACDTYGVKHTGPYRHLGNAWSSGMAHGRAKVFAQNKKTAPFETYENDPQETDENELVTMIRFPSR